MKRALLLVLILSFVGGARMQTTQMDPVERTIESPASRAAAVPAPVQLTAGGCCTQPFWSPDGKEVRYIDKPAGGKLGIYGVNPASARQAPVLVSQRVEDSRIAGPYRIETTRTTTILVRLSDGKQFKVPAQGRGVQFSPDFKRIAWNISNLDLPPEQQVTAIWVANIDGSGAKRLATLRRGGVVGWISQNELLVNGQDPKSSKEQVLWALNIADGKLREITRAELLRSPVLSPTGRWVIYYTAFGAKGGNGLWLVNTSGGESKALPREAFGAYQWRPGAEDRLLIVPFKADAQYHEFWQLDPQTLEMAQLTKAEQTPLKIANGDWRVSPDGRYVAFVESKDRNIWALELPGAP